MRAAIALRPLYAQAPPFHAAWLDVAGGHAIHVQQFGTPAGLPAVVLHGGPGSGSSPLAPRFFDPRQYRVICVDQRGAGLSRPRGGLEQNTTPDLLADLRSLRAHLGIERWLVVGGSWGATLAVAHALDAPEAVAGLLLRGLFLARPGDVDAFFDGAAHGRPLAWAAYERGAASQGVSLIDALHRSLCAEARTEAAATALHWWRWEQSLSHPDAIAGPDPDAAALDAQIVRLRIQSHYLRHRCWLNEPPLLARCAALPDVPMLLVHGREDRICLPAAAVAFHERVPRSHLRWIDGAGHDPTHPGMIDAMICALDSFAERRDFT